MSIRSVSCFVLITALGAVMAGCVSSEESGGTHRAERPQRTIPPLNQPQELPTGRATTLASPDSARRTVPRLRARQDTVQASVVKKSKPPARIVKPIEKPANPVYTVQVGAFGLASNALRLQKQAKDRFPDALVFNRFESFDKLYRVSVGKFTDRKQAAALRRALIKQYPKDYEQCWVNYLAP